MTSQNFLIGPMKDGIRKDIKPFAIPEDSFDTLVNAYIFRGRIKRRLGYTKLGRLTNGTPVMGLRTWENFGINVQTLVAFDTTDSYEWNGSSFIPLSSVMPVTWSGTDYQFFYTTNYANALWTTNSKSGLHGYAITEFTNQAGAGPWTVQVTSAGNTFQAGDQIYFLNVTGAGAANNLRSGVVTVSGNPFTISSATGGAFTNGLVNSGIALSTTRSVPNQDGIRYYGNLDNGDGWANYNPPIDPNNTITGALLIFPYRGYLIFLNTTEGNESGVQNFGNRARWTQIGTPYYSAPVPSIPSLQSIDPKAARDDLFGRGGANDAPTDEIIVGASFIRDILIVYFERSTWRLRFVNNSQNPFVWERINVELGSDCTFSTIPFDKGLMAIGNRGIVISDGNDTIRFDDKIPDEIFDIGQSENGLERVYGIRTFRTRLNFWTFRSADSSYPKFPNQVLVFNYNEKTWSLFNDSFTCFGYYYETSTGKTWGDLTDRWDEYTTVSWNSGVSQEGYENIVAGNQQGYVLVLEEGIQNDASLSISNIAANVFTSNNHNLDNGTWISLIGVTGTTSSDGVSLNGRNYKVANNALNENNFSLLEYKPIDGGSASGATYTYTISYSNLIPGTIQINIGTLVFTDPNIDGVLVEASSAGSGTIDYSTGEINLIFSPVIASTDVWIRIVSLDPNQGLDEVETTGAYTGGGEIEIISNFDIRTKFFNFFQLDQNSRISKVDFYTEATTKGEFTCNVFCDSSNVAVNEPLPDNLRSNVVETSPNPYQIGKGDSSMFRFYANAIGQTIQLQMTLQDYQMATNYINSANVELLAFIMTLRKGGRIV